MKCHEFEARLHELLDDRRSPETDALLVEHAAACDLCGQLLAGQRVLFAGLRRGVKSSPGSQLAQNVLAGYQTGPGYQAGSNEQTAPIEAVVLDVPSPRRRAWHVLAWLAATAAAVAIAVSIYLSSQPDRPKIARALPAVDSVRPVNPSEPPSRPRIGGRGPTLGAFQLLPRRGYGAAIADMATSSLPDAVERIEDVERFAPGIRPIRVSFTMLWDALWRTIPGLSSQEPDPKAFHGRLDVKRLV